jgi:hypothetical protein
MPSALMYDPKSQVSKDVQWPRGETYEYGGSRYTVIIALATWSARAKMVAKKFGAWESELKSRRISVVGIFTHDTPADIIHMAATVPLSFRLAKVDLAFVAHLLNPKVPTIWIADHTGQIIQRKERPTDQELDVTRRNLLVWTDF